MRATGDVACSLFIISTFQVNVYAANNSGRRYSVHYVQKMDGGD